MVIRQSVKRTISKAKFNLAKLFFKNIKMNVVSNSVSDFLSTRSGFRYQKDILEKLRQTSIQDEIQDESEIKMSLGQEYQIEVREGNYIRTAEYISRALRDKYPEEFDEKLEQSLTSFMRGNVLRWKVKIQKKLIIAKSRCKICGQQISVSYLKTHSKFCYQSYDLRQNIKNLDDEIVSKIKEFEGILKKISIERNTNSKKFFKRHDSIKSNKSYGRALTISPTSTSKGGQDNKDSIHKKGFAKMLKKGGLKLMNASTFDYGDLTTKCTQMEDFNREITRDFTASAGGRVYQYKKKILKTFRDNFLMVDYNPRANHEKVVRYYKRREKLNGGVKEKKSQFSFSIRRRVKRHCDRPSCPE